MENNSVVLYVDDVQANLMLFEASFSTVFTVLVADSAKKALEILEKQEIHVLVADQNMPGMTGNELLEIVAKEYPDIMRFMITAYTDYETVVDAINKGQLYGFFNKPYNVNDVKHAILRSIEVRSLRIKNREMLSKLEKANEMMVGLDNAKTDFLSSVSREIRSPISKIMTTVHMIKDKIDSSELTELLYLLDVSVSRLENFSQAANHLVRIRDESYILNRSSVSLNEIVEIGIIEKGNVLSKENISVKLDENSTQQTVSGEFDLLQVAFSSLFGYITDHVVKGGEVVVATQKTNDGSVMEIKSKDCQFTEKEKSDLISLSFENPNFDKDFRLETILVSEIMRVHNGKFGFTEQGGISLFSMAFSG